MVEVLFCGAELMKTENQPCPECRGIMVHFVETGEIYSNYSTHLDNCNQCQRFVEEVFQKQSAALESLARALRKKK